jgi:hypothetical protein
LDTVVDVGSTAIDVTLLPGAVGDDLTEFTIKALQGLSQSLTQWIQWLWYFGIFSTGWGLSLDDLRLLMMLSAFV